MKNALIIFVRNPVLGKVKTRLAASIGEEKALLIYVHLLKHTKEITQNITATKFVFYADHINEDDIWNGYEKRSQQGYNLGDRMKNAFVRKKKTKIRKKKNKERRRRMINNYIKTNE